jgi:hypothetical protein
MPDRPVGLRVAARSSEIVIEADLSAAPTFGDRVVVERLVANLVDNAASDRTHAPHEVRSNVPSRPVGPQ